MLTSKMTYRQKADYYDSLADRASDLEMRATALTHKVIAEDLWNAKWIIRAVGNHLSDTEILDGAYTTAFYVGPDERRLAEKVAFFYNLDTKANKLAVSFRFKANVFRDLADKDEDGKN